MLGGNVLYRESDTSDAFIHASAVRSLLLSSIIHLCGQTARTLVAVTARFDTRYPKIGLRPWAAAVNGWLCPHILKNVQLAFVSFRNKSWWRRRKNYIYRKNSKQIRKSDLTTFEAAFVQSARRIIVEKFQKPHQIINLMRFLAGLSSKNLWKSSHINGLQATSKRFAIRLYDAKL